jgi:hypothetical protein
VEASGRVRCESWPFGPGDQQVDPQRVERGDLLQPSDSPTSGAQLDHEFGADDRAFTVRLVLGGVPWLGGSRLRCWDDDQLGFERLRVVCG